MTKNEFIPVNHFELAEEDKELLNEAVEANWISSAGKYIELFENEWAEACGASYGIAVSNGTTALQVAVEALEIGPGDEVILPTFTIISCIQAILNVGAKPILVDCENDTWCMSVSQIEGKITKNTKAIMVVHMYGHPVDMDPILKMAKKYNLKIIEDAAEVHGAEYLSKLNGKNEWLRCGGIGDISTFSFFANKLITTGEGGMVVTSDPKLAEKSRSLRNLCFRAPRRFLHTELGHQFRLTNMQAAIGLGQVRRIERIVENKRVIGTQYKNELMDLSDFIQLPVEKEWAKNVYWVNSIVLNDSLGLDAEEFGNKLREKGIDTRLFFWCMHEQPVLLEKGLFKNEFYPNSERIARKGLYLPSGTALKPHQISRVTDEVRKIIRNL